MPKPSYLPPPPLRDHQFICFEFMNMTVTYGTAIEGASSPIVQNGLVANSSFITSPSAVTPRQIQTLASMTDETFTRLAPILHFVIENSLVDNKHGLASVTAYLMPKILKDTGEQFGQYSLDQAQVYVMNRAMAGFHIHWAALADLYNSLPDDQQEAVNGLFSDVLNRPLADLYSVSVPALTLPDSFRQNEWRHEADDGMTYVHSEYLDAWLREDIAAGQFWVEGHLPDGISSTFIGSAATLEEAIGYASAFVMNANEGGRQAFSLQMLDSITIDFNRRVIAEASLVQPSRYRDSGVKLNWKVSSPAEEKFPEQVFTKALHQAESKLGLRWNRKPWIETDLAP